MRTVILFITAFLIGFNSMNIEAQNPYKNYMDLEKLRLNKVDSINKEIETFINKNISSYSLSEIRINEVKNDLLNIHDGSSHPITGKNLEKVLLNLKQMELRNLYFKNNSGILKYFIPNKKPDFLRQNCFNGGFENGYINYTYEQRNINPAAHFNSSCSNTDSSLSAFQPSGFNNFNTNASLVTPGLEPHLFSLGVPVNRVKTGNWSLKLNPTPISPADAQTGNRTTVSRDFIINEDTIEFSYLFLGHANTGHSRSFFRYRLIDNITQTVLASACFDTNQQDCKYTTLDDGNNTLVYTPEWIDERINTSQLIGRDVRLEFKVSDCNFRGHFGTVYIDDICGVTETNPTYGDLNINPIDINCPNSNIDICGDFSLPLNTTFTSLTLDIIDSSDDSIISTLSNAVINGSEYCFEVDLSIFGLDPSGSYYFQVTLNNSSTCVTLDHLVETGGTVMFNDCSEPCDLITDPYLSGQNLLCWEDITDGDYEIEFITQEICPSGATSNPIPTFVTYTQSSNCIDLTNVIDDSGGKCFRWRIRTDCGPWSDWCLAGSGENPSPSNFILFNDCIPTNPCENFESEIVLTQPDDNISSGNTVNYDTYIDITASNLVENGATSLYQASNSIKLVAGFHAQNITNQGGFIARIIPCEPAIDPPSGQRLSQELKNVHEIKVYPIPAKERLNISTEKIKITSIELFDIYGNRIQSFEKLNTLIHELDVNRLSRGYYVVRIVLEDGSSQFKNIMLK